MSKKPKPKRVTQEKQRKRTKRQHTKGGAKGRTYSDEAVNLSLEPGLHVRTTTPTVATTQLSRKVPTSLVASTPNEAKTDTDYPRAKEWIEKLSETDLKHLRKEFQQRVKPYKPTGECEAWAENVVFNRYDDVKCLDKTRVKLLKKNPDDCDYIHASFVQAFAGTTYICTQGPLSATVSHFWQMVVEQECQVVLQLCSFYEDGKEKCNEYYPPMGVWKTYGYVSVRVAQEFPCHLPKVTVSKMSVRFDDGLNLPKATVMHIFYNGWPDHAFADSVEGFLGVRSLVHQYMKNRPVVCHCSAGIGRTGTFAMIDMVVHKLTTSSVPENTMIEMVHELREQRMHAIQNDLQYLFLHRAVLEILLTEYGMPKTPAAAKFIDEYDIFVARKNLERIKLRAAAHHN